LKQKLDEYQKEIDDIKNKLDKYEREGNYDFQKKRYTYGFYDKETKEPAPEEIIDWFNYLKNLQKKVRHIKIRIKGLESLKLESYLTKVIVLDKKTHSQDYPEWLKFSMFVDDYYGYLHLQPIINIYELLKSKGDLYDATKVIRRINTFWIKYIGENILQIADTEYEGFDEYAKKVFNKEIRKRIKEEVDPNGRLHSVVFKKPIRQYGITSTTLFQIVPRFKKTYSYNQFERRSVIEKRLEDLLKEYGWIRSLNYQDTLER